MAKITLNLGAVLSELLKGANSNFTELYEAISKIQETIADDGEKAVVYTTVDAMVTGLNTGKDGAGNDLGVTIGDEIYILDDETPDFWVSAVSTTSTTGTKPASWEKGTNYVFGKYTIRVSKSREIDLADYQKIANLVTSIGADSDDTHYPSAKAVYTAVKDKVDKVSGKDLSTNDYTNDEKTKVADNTSARHSHSNKTLLDAYDQTNANIKDAVTKKHSHSNKSVLDGTTASYTTEEKTKLGNIDDSLLGVTADQIGKVKDVKVNGTSVLDEATGVAAITVADLATGFVAVATTDSVWATKEVNGTTYQAIKVAKTDTALGVFNSDNQEIVVQKVYDDNYLYLCVGTAKIACTIRKLSGGAVGSGGGDDDNSVSIAKINENIVKDPSKTYLVWSGAAFPGNYDNINLVAPVNSVIDWGDGTIEVYTTARSDGKMHIYKDGINVHLITLSGFTSIPEGAFEGSKGLKSVTFGSDITSIGAYAFYAQTNLKSITIPGNITSIELSAFERCSGLETIVFESATPVTYKNKMIPDTIQRIIVPKAAVSAYKTAAGWSAFADKIGYTGSISDFGYKLVGTATVSDGSISFGIGTTNNDGIYVLNISGAAIVLPCFNLTENGIRRVCGVYPKAAAQYLNGIILCTYISGNLKIEAFDTSNPLGNGLSGELYKVVIG